MTLHRRSTVLAAALGLGLTLAGCGEADRGGPHNEADTRFAQHMIVHHEGAIEMAELAEERATTPEVRDLAAAIAEAQGPEIATMTGWLEAWGEDVPDAADHGGGHGGTDGMEMDGLDQSEAMSALRGASGTELDARFLELMTAHHEGAVEMARTHLEEGEAPDALRLAETIIEDQNAEIATMRGLLAGL